MSDFQWTFGPAVVALDGSDDLTATCLSGRFTCRGYMSGKCYWNKTGDGESRQIPATNETPDWCEYKAGALRDAQEMRARE